jgi:hypothetical protein
VRRAAQLVPIFGIALFVIFYFCAASLYPGGTRLDPSSPGYSHAHNFWCDLLDATSYSGAANRGRPFALTATVVLPLSLIPFWLFVPTLFRASRATCLAVSTTGIASMLIAALLPIAHDSALNGACAFLAVASATSLVCLFQSRELGLLGLAAIALAVSTVNFVMWKTGYRLDVMPMVQKTATLLSLSWILATSVRIIQKNKPEEPR